ncbi:hypothetical protein DY000_02011602 [Brassica cretica]|uniref:Very-long-chain (3R)-3-hydroxyacyl-CoA dehydratase n=1 Tax=Brassica cretica TaxID=69181 RepID=A0ABQ7CRE4_BRACR|nr:hypothetical protein DY000_02011602 [Brassica cretica]
MSDRIPWRFFSFVIEMIALTSPRKTGRIQTLIQPSHVSFVDGFQAASVLHSTVPVGIEGISGCIGALIWSYIPYMMHFRQRPSRRGGGSVTSV